MIDRSKWPPVVGEQFIQAWINLKELPGGMMQANQPPYRFGPIPTTTSCRITTSPDEAELWRVQGESVMEVHSAAGVLEAQPQQVFTEDEIHAFYEAWEFNEEDPGRLEFHSLVREIEHRVLERTRGVTGMDAGEVYRLAREHGATLEDDNGAVPAFWCIPMERLVPLAQALAAGVAPAQPEQPEEPKP